jgi:hypothetical protein
MPEIGQPAEHVVAYHFMSHPLLGIVKAMDQNTAIESRPGTIRENMDKLTMAAEGLEETIERLAQRIVPICSQAPPTPTPTRPGTERPSSSNTSLGSAIECVTDRLRTLERSVHAVMESVEL